MKKGAGDYVTTRNGKLALVRKLMPDGTTHVTRLGKLFFRGERTEYVVSVPVAVEGTSAKGRIQNRQTMLPVDMLGIGRIMQDSSIPEQTRISRVKSHVLQQLHIKTQAGKTVLMEITGETFTYKNDEPWLISALTTDIQNGEAVTSAVMRQPLGAGPVSCAAFLPHSEHIVDEAWETHADKLCVPRQLASVLRISLNEAIGIFDDFLPAGWQTIGVTPLQLKELCRRQGRSFYYLNGTRMMDNYEPPDKNRSLKSIALTSFEGHAYLYTSARFVCTRHLSDTASKTPVRFSSESHYIMPPVSEWKEWNGTASPGYHYTEDLNQTRAQLLLGGRSPKVILRSAAAADMIALRYMCVKSVDG